MRWHRGNYQIFLSLGTIYIAFGTYVPWSQAPVRVRNDFLEALNELPDYRIVFSYNGPCPNFTLDGHIKLTKWAPQLDLLAHPKTKVFLTHGGLKRLLASGFISHPASFSIKEGLCTKTPFVLMPMFAEQAHNAKFMLSLGLGTVLSKFSVNKEAVVGTLKEACEES